MAEDNRELRRRRRKRCLICLLLLAVFKIAIILPLTLILMQTRTPKFRVTSAAFGAFAYSAADPSFDITLYAELALKNTNFGRFNFDSTTVYFSYNGAVVGSALVPGWTARARSTRKIRVQVELSSAGLVDRVQVKSDLEGGVLPLNSRAALTGEVEVLRVFEREKTAEMDCFIAINLMQTSVGYLSCQ
ncbi:late embryogenesis abundant protein At1g64065-like [Salvia hispanica]|uniref:late embryogenesis abundant protein At1g64065-like n=1 Tax=Salvia hispanica TaxID=49212 RepID=UPI00200959C5|nr:late embryogenesis abundant protein At1g64065-like [Salvia hispanica]